MMKEILTLYYQSEMLTLREVKSLYPNLEEKQIYYYFDLIQNKYLVLRPYYTLGVIDLKKHVAFLIQKDDPNDLKLEHRDLNNAMDRDLVLVKKFRKFNKVEVILKRNLTKIIATIYRKGRGNKQIISPNEKLNQLVVCQNLPVLEDETVVILNVVKITADYITTSYAKTIGHKTDKNIDYLILAYENDWPITFSKKLKVEARELTKKPIDITGRKDLRKSLIFTIDGSDTKDIDDALSISEISPNVFEVGIHIADVSHYVEENSIIDKEAKERSNSLYFPNFVIPMLPEELSNDLCSLSPNTDKLAVSLIIRLNSEAKILSHELTLSVINSSYQLTYDKVNALLLNNKKYINNEVDERLILLNNLANKLNEQRDERGQINFATKEVYFTFDNDSNISDVSIRKEGPAEKLIESFMILANEVVAGALIDKNYPVILRTHESPDEYKLDLAYEKLKEMNINVDLKNTNVVTRLQKITNNTSNHPLKYIIHSQLLRSMQRAKYSSELIGHFGLASKRYAHFTAPIRRYSDLLLHRIIKDLLLSKASLKKINYYKKIIPEIALNSSTQERVAIQIERDANKIASYHYMKDKIGKEYKALIVLVNPYVMFAELENGIEIALPTSYLDFNVIYDDKNQTLRSKRETYELGKEVLVKLISINEDEKQLNFTIIEKTRNKRSKDGKNNRSKS